MSETLEQKAARLAGGKPGKLDDLKKPRGKHGGARAGAGGSKPTSKDRAIKRGIDAWVDTHIKETVKIQITDPKTGKSFIVTKPRVVRMLELLYEIGSQDRSYEAIDKWLNRALGRPVQPLVGDKDDDGENGPILIRLDI